MLFRSLTQRLGAQNYIRVIATFIGRARHLSRNFSVGPDGDRFLKLHQEEDKSTELGRRIPGTKMIGPSLNQYRITASNGAGGMGEVFWARDAQLHWHVPSCHAPILLLGEAFLPGHPNHGMIAS